MALNKETQDLLVESVAHYAQSLTNVLKDSLAKGDTNIDLMKKIVKLEELRQSLAAKNSSE